MGTVAALAMLEQSLEVAAGVSALIAKANAEKREVSLDELNQLAANDDAKRAALDAAIAKAGG